MSPVALDVMLKEVLGEQLSPGVASFLDLFADDAVLECPFAPPGGMHRLVGRDAIAAYFRELSGVQDSDGMTLAAVHRSTGQQVAVLEYHGTARSRITGSSYPQRYVAVVQTGDGRIRLFREYWDPRPVVAAFGGPQLRVAQTP